MMHTQHFGGYLGILLHKYNIKKSELASELSVSRQYVSSIITNKKTPSRDCFDAILTFLNKHLTPSEEQSLANKLIYAKTGIKNPLNQLVKTEVVATCVSEQILLEDFRKLNSKAQIEVIRFVRRKEIEMLDRVSKNAKTTEQQAKQRQK
jgi:transcriptional regulator with XRE-family HTH domain